MEFPKISCIYCIECKVNNKKYIGKTKDLLSRYKYHFYYLSKSKRKHINYLLEEDFSKYGKENFEFYILEYCDENNLNDREIYWIKKYNAFEDKTCGYNLDSGVGSPEKYSFLLRKENINQLKIDEKNEALELLEKYSNRKFLGEEIQNFKKEFSYILKTSKETNYRYMGIRAINGLLKEMNILDQTIISGTISIKNKGTRYWKIINAKDN